MTRWRSFSASSAAAPRQARPPTVSSAPGSRPARRNAPAAPRSKHGKPPLVPSARWPRKRRALDSLCSEKRRRRHADPRQLPLGLPRRGHCPLYSRPDNALNDISSGIRNGYAYLTIAPNGTVYQNHPLDEWGYHAGESRWPALGGGVSQYLVGIEICASGKLRRIDDNHYRPWYNEASYLTPLGKSPKEADDLRADQVRTVSAEANRVAGSYERYTDAQETALKAVRNWLHDNKPATFSYDLVLGHDEVSPGRKNDPGGALSITMPAFRTWLKTNA